MTTCDYLFLFLIFLDPLCLLDEPCISLQLLLDKSPKQTVASDNTYFFSFMFSVAEVSMIV